MEQLEFVNQTADWWMYPLQPNEATEVERVWAHLLLNKRVEQGPGVSVTGNLITLFKELSTTNSDWKARLAV